MPLSTSLLLPPILVAKAAGGGGGSVRGMSCKRLVHTFDDIISVENLLLAWREFLKGKTKKQDVRIFGYQLIDNLADLHNDLKRKTYQHGGYQAFNITNPKPRNIHKASVRDRLLHHAVYRILYSYFDTKFIADSFSCRKHKGTHKTLDRFTYFARKASCNNTKTVWVLKCDVRKFFASVDHERLKVILARHIQDQDILWLVWNIVDSFYSTVPGKGLPLGNLTSQLLVNVYMNEFDQFVKHRLKIKYYVRYADDFVLLSQDRSQLERLLPLIREYLDRHLKLELHPKKVSISALASGIDFLGWVHFPYHRQIRTATKRRMIARIKHSKKPETLISYKGLLKHGDTYTLSREVLVQDLIKWDTLNP